jgi:hypothetical protein
MWRRLEYITNIQVHIYKDLGLVLLLFPLDIANQRKNGCVNNMTLVSTTLQFQNMGQYMSVLGTCEGYIRLKEWPM